MNVKRLASAAFAVAAVLATSSVPAALASGSVPTAGVSASVPANIDSTNALGGKTVTCPWSEGFNLSYLGETGTTPVNYWWASYYGYAEAYVGCTNAASMEWYDSGTATTTGVYGVCYAFGPAVSHQMSGAATIVLRSDLGVPDQLNVSYTASGDGYLTLSGTGTTQSTPHRNVTVTAAGTLSTPADECGTYFNVRGEVKITYS